MGLGGYLTWTAVAREIHQVASTKVFPFEMDYVESGDYWEELGVSLVVKPEFAIKKLSESFLIHDAARTMKSLWGKHSQTPSAQFFVKFQKPPKAG